MIIYNYVSSCPNKTSYFGGVTAGLHNALINDPKPYRKEVKDLLVEFRREAFDYPVCLDEKDEFNRLNKLAESKALKM